MIAEISLLSFFWLRGMLKCSNNGPPYYKGDEYLMSRIRTRIYTLNDSYLLLFVAIACLFLLTACNRSNSANPNQQNGILDFGSEEIKLNTYSDKNGTVADTSAYSFYSNAQFIDKMNLAPNETSRGIYEERYQQKALETLQMLKGEKTYTIDNPLIVENPFGTNECGIYVYFGKPEQKLNIYYTVSVEDTTIPDHTDTMYINRTNQMAIEGQMIGLIEGRMNKLLIQIYDVNGAKLNSRVYYLNIADRESLNPYSLNAKVTEDAEMARGLFSFYASGTGKYQYYLFYDNYGILRAAIPTLTKDQSARIEQVSNRIFYPCLENQFADVDNLGYVLKIYSWEEAGNLIDFAYDDENGIMLFIEEDKVSQYRLRVLALNLAKNEWTVNTDFRKLIPDYDTIFTKSDNDWLGLESIQVIDGRDYVVSANESDTIFRINNIYNHPVIRWMIGPESIWKDTEYESLLLVETGDKIPVTQTDSISFFESKKLKDGQGYLALINYHQNTVEDPNSYFLKYVVDENTNRYRIVQKIAFPYHTYLCSGYVYGTHVILSLGTENVIYEYNEKGEMIIQMTIPEIDSSYRVNKYTMDRYWF